MKQLQGCTWRDPAGVAALRLPPHAIAAMNLPSTTSRSFHFSCCQCNGQEDARPISSPLLDLLFSSLSPPSSSQHQHPASSLVSSSTTFTHPSIHQHQSSQHQSTMHINTLAVVAAAALFSSQSSSTTASLTFQLILLRRLCVGHPRPRHQLVWAL